jgi:hypothetical protein
MTCILVILLTGEAIDSARLSAAGQHFTIGFVSGNSLNSVIRHLYPHAAQPIRKVAETSRASSH